MKIAAGLCLVLMVALNSSADTEIYKWIDKNGTVHFSDKAKEKKKNYEPCGISLKSISKVSGFPGDTIELFGQWGDSQGEKLPRINKGKSNDLEVISWSNSIVKVKIPQGLEAGIYSVGVYCNDLSKGGTYSSDWKKFEVVVPTVEESTPQSPRPTPQNHET